MATASREFPWFVLIETSKGTKFYSSYETKGEADADCARLVEKKLTATVVAKADGDSVVPDMATVDVPPVVEDRQSLDVVADKDGNLHLKIDKASLSQFLSPEDAAKVESLKAGESVKVDADTAAIGEITKGSK